ncbi:MAG: aminoacyl-tRNA hydrolase, partial [Zymomonas sp.]|nr:aminoacyl-tRNA hydrolase [Zymomonas sp.]
MQIWAGLGNPGAQYALNRHNAGFMAIDAIAELHNFDLPKKRFLGWAIEARLGNEKLLLLKPATFMNDSGQSIGEAM